METIYSMICHLPLAISRFKIRLPLYFFHTDVGYLTVGDHQYVS